MVKDYDGIIDPSFTNPKFRNSISKEVPQAREVALADPLLKSEFILKKTLTRQATLISRASRPLYRTNTLVLNEEEEALKSNPTGGLSSVGRGELDESSKFRDTNLSGGSRG
jgi:hypothetical protein